ncbi:MAG: hypothetical protein AABX04_05465 [Nanoarchaeota archaeon]
MRINSLILIVILALALLIVGCSGASNSINIGSSKSICGNGVEEKGETAENCCTDVKCSDGFECKNKIENGNTVYFCKKLNKEESYEFKKFISYEEEINTEYDKPEESLINWGSMISKVQSMKDYLAQLKQKGYDTSVDDEFLKHFERRINLNKLVYEKTKDFDSLGETEQKSVIDELIILYQQEKDALSSINGSMKIEIDKQYDYDLNGKIDYANERINELQQQKERLEKGQSATIDVTNFDSSCYSSSGYLTSVNMGIKNTGGFDVEEPRVDVFLIDGGKQVDKKTDNYFGYDTLESGEERFERISFMLGYVGGESSPCKTYDLKINFRSGANPKVIATKTVKVEIK